MGVFLKWDSQKVLKMAHFVIFRHIGGVRGSKKRLALMFSGSRSSLPKMAILRALWTEKLIFSPKTLQCTIDLTPKPTEPTSDKLQFVQELCLTKITIERKLH